jgi:5-methyltetrahydropteroyltriglutamate--homocysteine methyltransferase
MPQFLSTAAGSYPLNTSVEDTMNRPSLSQTETDELIQWATRDQADLPLDGITEDEGYRESVYYFYQKRLDGITSRGMVKQTFGAAGFGIECARLIGEIKNSRFGWARNWKLANHVAPTRCRVKQTVTGPHVLTRFRVNQRHD